MGLCNCKYKVEAIPGSDLFVPKIDINVDKGRQRKLLKFRKTITAKKNLFNQTCLPNAIPNFSTEKLIFEQSMYKKIKPTGSMAEGQKIKYPLEKAKSVGILNPKLSFKTLEKIKYTGSNRNIPKISQSDTKQEEITSSNAQAQGNGSPQRDKPERLEYKDRIQDQPEKIQNSETKVNTAKSTGIFKNVECEIVEGIFSSSEEIYIAKVLLGHYLFHRCTNDQLNFLIGEMNVYQIDEDTEIFNEGECGSCMFIIKEGIVELSSPKTKTTKRLTSGDVFGELALLKNNVSRLYSARSITKLIFYIVDAASFSKISDSILVKEKFTFDIFNYVPQELHEKINLLQTKLSIANGKSITDINVILGINEGEISLVDKTDKEITVFKKGHVMGIKNAIFPNNIKNYENMKIIAKEKAECYILRTASLIEVFGLDYHKAILNYILNSVLEKNEHFFSLVFQCNLNGLASKFAVKEYWKGSVIRRECEPEEKKKIIIIIHGEADYVSNKIKNKNELSKKQTDKMTTGYLIGEEYLSGKRVQSNIVTESDALYSFECTWKDFKDTIIFSKIKASLSKVLGKLSSIELFHKVPEWKLIKILLQLNFEEFKCGEKIIKLNEVNEKVYFIHRGSVKAKVPTGTLKQYHRGNSIGEISVLSEKENKIEFVSSSAKTKVFSIEKEQFFGLMKNNYFNQLTKKKICLENTEIFPGDLYYLSTLHKSKKSNIYLVHNKMFLYTVKAVNIECIEKNKLGPIVLNEKVAAKKINNPLLVHYVKTLKNSKWCFFLEEYIKGMTLQEYIEMCKPFSNFELIQFYAGCLFLMLEVINHYGIIHRNIKPENIILETNGYPRLIDFSSCKKIKNGKTRTLIGTPLYISPEVLSGKGYSYSCDYWSVGIILFYLMYGEYPFGNRSLQPESVYKEILNKSIDFNSFTVEKENGQRLNAFNSLIDHLLKKNVEERYTSFSQIERTEFFKGFDWDKLRKRKLKPPFTPQVIQLTYEKMLNNISSPFFSFLAKDQIDDGSWTGKDDGLELSKDIVVLYDNEDKKKNVERWFDKF